MKEKIPYHKPILRFEGSPILSNGKYVHELEKTIQEYYDVDFVFACASCTQGLLITKYCFDKISNFDWTINTPAFTWKSIKEVAKILNNDICYHDIDQYTWLMKYPNYNLGFVMGHHTFGNIHDIKEGLVIYDGAHALGARIKNFGLATVFSLAPTKLITACEGGLIITNDHELAEEIKRVRDIMSRMPEHSAYFALETWKDLDLILEWKKKVHDYYTIHIPGIHQKIPITSNYNTIGFLNLSHLKIPEHIEVKYYYEPLIKPFEIETDLTNTIFVYNHIICLPSWFGCPYKKIVEDILEMNNL